jgi:uncharacterized membrane protein
MPPLPETAALRLATPRPSLLYGGRRSTAGDRRRPRMNRTIADLAHRMLGRRQEALSSAESRVLASTIEGRTVARDVNTDVSDRQSRGDRVADSIGFVVFLAAWTSANAVLLGRESFDPYPFIFLNLILSMVAALQAPIIMMAQNRQAQRDRIDAAHDYEVNLKAEIEVMALHEKVDELRRKEIALLREEIAVLTAELRDWRAEGSAGART